MYYRVVNVSDCEQAKLDKVTERWGVKVSSVEIREIIPPKNVLDAMTMQMAAMITGAEGKSRQRY